MEMEAAQKLHFIKTVERQNGWQAMIADAEFIGGLAGVKALRSASKISDTFNGMRIRGGVHFYTAEQLQTRLPDLEKQGMDKSAAAFRRALECINARQSKVMHIVLPKEMTPA